MTRVSLMTAACALVLAACSGGSDAPEEEAATGAVEGDTDTAAAPAETSPSPVDAILAEARACELPEEAEIPLIDEPEETRNPMANAAQADAYIASVQDEACMFELPSGLVLRIRDAVEEGVSPITGDMVTVHYRGMFPWGTEFDSSYAREEPATFPSDRLIRGWVEALPLMRTGETWELYIKPELGYGARGTQGGPIGPNQALVFQLELLDVPGR